MACEQADTHTLGYDRWMAEHFFLMVPAQQYVGQFLGTFKEFPPRQKVGSFGIDQVLGKPDERRRQQVTPRRLKR
jgi:arylsulfatase